MLRSSSYLCCSANVAFWQKADLARRLPVCPLFATKRTWDAARTRLSPPLLTQSGHRPGQNPAAQQTPARCAILFVGSTGATSSETPRVRHSARRHDSGVAAGGAPSPVVRPWPKPRCPARLALRFHSRPCVSIRRSAHCRNAPSGNPRVKSPHGCPTTNRFTCCGGCPYPEGLAYTAIDCASGTIDSPWPSVLGRSITPNSATLRPESSSDLEIA